MNIKYALKNTFFWMDWVLSAVGFCKSYLSALIIKATVSSDY